MADLSENVAAVIVRCSRCAGAGGYASGGMMFVSDWEMCEACDGTGTAAVRIVPACAEPFAKAED